MLGAVLTLAIPAFAAGFGLAWAARRLPADEEPLVERIDAILPQTQCAQCGYPGCRPYARAIADGSAEINQCPPGGEQTIHALAELLGREALPLDPARGTEPEPRVAVIREAECIGCARCLPACPVDAIVGAPQYLHTVIERECTGCELCLDPCPVDCIDLVPVRPPPGGGS
ncbi:electron transport complex subunit RsxB [Lentisalinibacter salinarum]|uniref:electron transport complex subunit RsxB n=1 Tax=Lentisalinibacter salinarum TaxID=2992239 RepID=UPI00386F16ED